MFYYFPDNYMWSSAFNLALMAGGSLGEMHRWLAPLRDGEPDAEAWGKAWEGMAGQQEEQAARDLQGGLRRSAGLRYLRASIYHASGERQIAPGPEKAAGYQAALAAFNKAVELAPLNVERIEVPSPDGVLPGYLIPARTAEPAPVVIFYGGFDVTKEILYGFVEEEFVRRGITCLVMDSPGVGEPLRLRNVPSRPDYEVPTGAVIDYLETRADVDADRIGVMGISLGGYYAPRSAAFEPRIKACAAWGGIWDWGATWEKRWATRSKTVSVPWFQLPWVMGTDTMEAGLERVKQWTLVDVLPKLTQPLLIVHGENDRQVAVEDAHKAYEAAGSADKTLRIFTVAEGGAEHCQTDEPDPARQLIADWFGQRLGTLPAQS
ncbi:alpha/beta fold hydrolase [Nonomuraea sp. MCN248]|uniref:Alpha/beta fold hydrolase n=1 Tax=Nonomuraea corallina TaxID=2989783 RepID=A0ABT4SL61_9ACTN|nr:alpha/beta fold hydrolase [Nonomuraea corallina]MDA0637743.1 alpha/beta fold hydrolase [Nonomuraea corallina]